MLYDTKWSKGMEGGNDGPIESFYCFIFQNVLTLTTLRDQEAPTINCSTVVFIFDVCWLSPPLTNPNKLTCIFAVGGNDRNYTYSKLLRENLVAVAIKFAYKMPDQEIAPGDSSLNRIYCVRFLRETIYIHSVRYSGRKVSFMRAIKSVEKAV